MTDFLLQGTKNFIICDYEKAITDFTDLISSEVQSDKVLGYLYRGSCYLELANLESDFYKKAIVDFLKGIELNKSSFELKYKLGIAYFKSKNFQEADSSFRGSLINSNNSEQREKLILWQSKTKLELDEVNSLMKEKISIYKFSKNWYQTDDYVQVTIDCNMALNTSVINVKIEKDLIQVYFEDFKLYEILLGNSIDHNSSNSKILTNKIDFKLIKERKGYNWITIDKMSAQDVHKYPSSMKSDFSKVNKDIEKVLKEEKDDPTGNDAMMHLFKEIYGNATDETKKAMMKSYSSSGGTVLSTNWGEVEDKDYAGKDRPDAPEGQQWTDEVKK